MVGSDDIQEEVDLAMVGFQELILDRLPVEFDCFLANDVDSLRVLQILQAEDPHLGVLCV